VVKYATIVVWCMAAVFIVSAIALAVGAVLFPVGPVILFSGFIVSVGAGLVRVV
jgi:ABC-2 type transport system permease protein